MATAGRAAVHSSGYKYSKRKRVSVMPVGLLLLPLVRGQGGLPPEQEEEEEEALLVPPSPPWRVRVGRSNIYFQLRQYTRCGDMAVRSNCCLKGAAAEGGAHSAREREKIALQRAMRCRIAAEGRDFCHAPWRLVLSADLRGWQTAVAAERQEAGRLPGCWERARIVVIGGCACVTLARDTNKPLPSKGLAPHEYGLPTRILVQIVSWRRGMGARNTSNLPAPGGEKSFPALLEEFP
ncbi:hypothetical protein cyc_09292 [Cyclospora cayetanensis]|uniref:Uncharacterized protein n=1 Tax=Cyclospora cayetanensis TaxID=88456 RepID=A0A1D3D152_9EIME|nr:hypothetical protein cyc_09292 [Cyclospora cayetanensis]